MIILDTKTSAEQIVKQKTHGICRTKDRTKDIAKFVEQKTEELS